jgi:hypothetical protein
LKEESNSNLHEAIEGPNATPEHLDRALGDEDVKVRRAAARHPKATPEHLHTALGDEDWRVRAAAARHPKATPEHLDRALGDEDEWVRAAAADHPNATSENIHKALGDENIDVRYAAAKHPNATPEHIDRALEDKNAGVRYAAAGNPNSTPEHIDRALGDDHEYVRRAAAGNPKDIPEHLERALSDSTNEEILTDFINGVLSEVNLNEHTDDSLLDLIMESIDAVFDLRDALMEEEMMPEKDKTYYDFVKQSREGSDKPKKKDPFEISPEDNEELRNLAIAHHETSEDDEEALVTKGRRLVDKMRDVANKHHSPEEAHSEIEKIVDDHIGDHERVKRAEEDEWGRLDHMETAYERAERTGHMW